jgi:hypothetical protein
MTVQKATLKPYIEEIRQWVAQGRTDIWIAHALNSTPASISAFRSANGILRRELASERLGVDVPPPIAPPDAPPEETQAKPRRRSRAKKTLEPTVLSAAAAAAAGPGTATAVPPPLPPPATVAVDETPPSAPAKRRRRGGRGRSKRGTQPGFEATLDTGDEGYGFWMDGAVKDDPVFAEHWASRRGLIIRIEADQIVIRPDERE